MTQAARASGTETDPAWQLTSVSRASGLVPRARAALALFDTRYVPAPPTAPLVPPIGDDPRLDRLPEFDARSRDYPIRTLTLGLKPRGYTWSCPVQLNQGNLGACVGFSLAQELAARPVKVKNITDDTGRLIYYEAQKIDEWPGEAYEGTSVLAGAKECKAMGYYAEYRWAFGLDDLILAVGYKGPAVLGVNWYSGMMQADGDGFIHVTGQIVGGHAILCNAVSVKQGYFRLHNSWGSAWGRSGDCFITFEDMSRLLREYGEACIPVVRRLGA